LNSLSITAPSLQSFVATSLIKVITKIALSGVLSVEFSSLTTVDSFEVISGSNIKLPKLAALPTGTIFPTNLTVVSSVAGIAQSGASTGSGSSESSSTSTSDSTTHNSGGSTTHDSGGSHNSGGSGG